MNLKSSRTDLNKAQYNISTNESHEKNYPRVQVKPHNSSFLNYENTNQEISTNQMERMTYGGGSEDNEYEEITPPQQVNI